MRKFVVDFLFYLCPGITRECARAQSQIFSHYIISHLDCQVKTFLFFLPQVYITPHYVNEPLVSNFVVVGGRARRRVKFYCVKFLYELQMSCELRAASELRLSNFKAAAIVAAANRGRCQILKQLHQLSNFNYAAQLRICQVFIGAAKI